MNPLGENGQSLSLLGRLRMFTPIHPHTVTAGFPIPINATWVMGEQDALVWLGCTPPPVRYFR